MLIIMVFAIIMILCVVWAAVDAKNVRYGKGYKVKAQFKDAETGRTLHAGNGTSIGDAIADGFRKMLNSVSTSSHEDTITSKLRAMRNTLSEYRDRMFPEDIARCERYIDQMRNLLERKKEEDKTRTWQKMQEKEKKQAESDKRKVEKRASALDDRLSGSVSMVALLKAIDQAEEHMLDSGMSSYELARYPRLSVLHNSGSHEIVNDFMEKKFSELRDMALEPVNLSDLCKKADAIRKSIDIAYDDMPRQSQTVYLNYKEEVFGDE